MRFLADAQLPPILLSWLTDQGHEAFHVRDFNMGTANDDAVWAKACELSCHVITKDEDFVIIRERAAQGPSVVWLRIGNALNRVLVASLTSSFPDVIKALENGMPIVEVK